MKWVWIVAAALSAAPMAVNAATVVNGGFETGDFTGWTPIGAPDQFVVSSYTHPHTGSGTYFPVEGAKFALVGAYMFQSLTPEGISQDLDFNGSERLNGSAALLSFAVDRLAFNVEGFVRLTDSVGNSVNLFHQTTVGLGDFGGTPWIGFSVTPAAGHYRLEAFTFDHTSDAQQSALLLLDAFRITPVPEPRTWALLVGGFALTGVALRLRRPGALPG